MLKFTENLETDIPCKLCGEPMIVKTNKHTDHQFLGCSQYPSCNWTRPIPEEWIMRASGQPSLF